MRKIRRMVSVVIISCMMAGCLAGCGSGGEKQEARMENDRERKAGRVRSGGEHRRKIQTESHKRGI